MNVHLCARDRWQQCSFSTRRLGEAAGGDSSAQRGEKGPKDGEKDVIRGVRPSQSAVSRWAEQSRDRWRRYETGKVIILNNSVSFSLGLWLSDRINWTEVGLCMKLLIWPIQMYKWMWIESHWHWITSTYSFTQGLFFISQYYCRTLDTFLTPELLKIGHFHQAVMLIMHRVFQLWRCGTSKRPSAKHYEQMWEQSKGQMDRRREKVCPEGAVVWLLSRPLICRSGLLKLSVFC